MSKHPSDMAVAELSTLVTVNRSQGPIVRTFVDAAGMIWDVVPAFGDGGWNRVYGGYDLNQRTLPYIEGPGVAGRARSERVCNVGAHLFTGHKRA